jgi:hypothetical protein
VHAWPAGTGRRTMPSARTSSAHLRVLTAEPLARRKVHSSPKRAMSCSHVGAKPHTGLAQLHDGAAGAIGVDPVQHPTGLGRVAGHRGRPLTQEQVTRLDRGL